MPTTCSFPTRVPPPILWIAVISSASFSWGIPFACLDPQPQLHSLAFSYKWFPINLSSEIDKEIKNVYVCSNLYICWITIEKHYLYFHIFISTFISMSINISRCMYQLHIINLKKLAHLFYDTVTKEQNNTYVNLLCHLVIVWNYNLWLLNFFAHIIRLINLFFKDAVAKNQTILVTFSWSPTTHTDRATSKDKWTITIFQT